MAMGVARTDHVGIGGSCGYAAAGFVYAPRIGCVAPEAQNFGALTASITLNDNSNLPH